MLLHLTVRDFTIIEHLDLHLGPGMTVLTGETGAGKSILVDALGLALGERASAGVVRSGSERSEVSAIFDVAALPELRHWLTEQELDTGEGECILRRLVGADGRSRAWINGRPVPVQSLREVGEALVDIHGQHAHQSLLRRPTQRRILDEHGGHAAPLEEIARLHRRWSAIHAEIERRAGGSGDRGERLELLRYQVRELEELGLGEGELQALEEEHRRLAHAAELLETCRWGGELLAGEGEITTLGQIAALGHRLQEQAALDRRLGGIAELLETARIQVEEAAVELRRYADGLELDPERLQRLDARLQAVHDLARKHRVQFDEVAGLHERLAEELEILESSSGRLEELERELDALRQRYRELAQRLHELRLAAASSLSEAVTGNIRRLGMSGGRFSVDVQAESPEQLSPHGADRVEFLVSAGPGQPLQPLSRVASGGELSRISLAIQVIASQGSGVPTLIFDEVDAGIGGRIAEIVGQQLRRLGAHRQVLCITHLPQVASQASRHVQVQKRTARRATRARLEQLDGEQRVREIARMLGGVEITEQTLAHAREMLERS